MSLYYYLMVARAMYIEPPGEKPPVRLTVPAAAAILICVLVVIGLVYPRPLLDMAYAAASGFVSR
jgi:NADH:ubiquinone oxidoreductase subunit 2 (subunit N)